jgi:cbb3-type cytochrome oxidase maturation protein
MMLRACECQRMDILLLLIPMSVVLVLLIGACFWWSVSSGQFEDLEGPAHRIIADDDSPRQQDEAAADLDKTPPSGAGLTSVNPGRDRRP